MNSAAVHMRCVFIDRFASRFAQLAQVQVQVWNPAEISRQFLIVRCIVERKCQIEELRLDEETRQINLNTLITRNKI